MKNPFLQVFLNYSSQLLYENNHRDSLESLLEILTDIQYIANGWDGWRDMGIGLGLNPYLLNDLQQLTVCLNFFKCA